MNGTVELYGEFLENELPAMLGCARNLEFNHPVETQNVIAAASVAASAQILVDDCVDTLNQLRPFVFRRKDFKNFSGVSEAAKQPGKSRTTVLEWNKAAGAILWQNTERRLTGLLDLWINA